MPRDKKWIWEDVAYPHFQYDFKKLETLLASVSRKQGELNTLGKIISKEHLQESQILALEEEILSSCAIENEILDRQSVKSSIKEKLGFKSVAHYKEKTKESNFVDILIDANSNYKEPLSLEKLFSWHRKMFDSDNRLWNIKVGGFREKGTMQIVSGVIGKEKVFYEAPPHDRLEEEMNAYMRWFNSTPSSLLKASIAHLWFVIIHPFDDGNGRITRAISDMVLSDTEKSSTSRLYSLSKGINSDKKGYYRALEKSTGYIAKAEPMDITIWCEWFLETVEKSLTEALSSLSYIVEKAKFWERHRTTTFNQRQRRVLNMMLDKDIKSSENQLTTKKYKKMANTTAPTASRDIKSLLDLGCITQVVGTSGRNIRYEIVVMPT